jgi:hypothetical protein
MPPYPALGPAKPEPRSLDILPVRRYIDRRPVSVELGGKGVGSLKTFLWWFLTGAAMTLGVLMVQGGFQDLISGNKSFSNFLIVITGGGLLAGCIAIILNRLR